MRKFLLIMLGAVVGLIISALIVLFTNLGQTPLLLILPILFLIVGGISGRKIAHKLDAIEQATTQNLFPAEQKTTSKLHTLAKNSLKTSITLWLLIWPVALWGPVFGLGIAPYVLLASGVASVVGLILSTISYLKFKQSGVFIVPLILVLAASFFVVYVALMADPS
jgi:uncharacterized membrane protein